MILVGLLYVYSSSSTIHGLSFIFAALYRHRRWIWRSNEDGL